MEIAVRIATLEDVNRIYHLSNDPEIRKISYSQEEILYEEHVRWFSKKLSDRSCIFLIILDGNEFVGQIRFMCEGEIAEISISLRKEYRRKGIGKLAMRQALGYIRENATIQEIHAFVKKSNPISISYFEKCGFMRTADKIVHGVPSADLFFRIERGEGLTT
jgi:spore coat polysaccharide biosynthesis protein SpsF